MFWLRGFGHGEGSLDAGQREAERERQLQAFATRVGIGVADLSPEVVRGALAHWLGALGQPSLWVVDDLASGLTASLAGGLRRIRSSGCGVHCDGVYDGSFNEWSADQARPVSYGRAD